METDTESGKNIHWINFYYNRQEGYCQIMLCSSKTATDTLYSVKGQKILEYFFLPSIAPKNLISAPAKKMWLN